MYFYDCYEDTDTRGHCLDTKTNVKLGTCAPEGTGGFELFDD